MGLVNGSQGIVVGFSYEENRHFPIVKFDNIEQEITIHDHSWGFESDERYVLLKYLSFYHGQLRFTNRKV